MRWFGPTWHAPVCDPRYRSAAPLGEFCQACDTVVAEGERGLIVFCSPDLDGSFWWWFDGAEHCVCCWHIDCWQRAVLGPDHVPLTPRYEEAS